MIIDWQTTDSVSQRGYLDVSYAWNGSFAAGAAPFIGTTLEFLTLALAASLGVTTSPSGNTLPIEISIQTPIGAPVGGKGVVFKVSGGVLTIYAWDGSAWIANI